MFFIMSGHISQLSDNFYGYSLPEQGTIVGYAALREKYKLAVPLSHTICIISNKNRRYEQDHWKVFTPRHLPDDSLYGHLVFAIKYEGVNLLLLKKLFEKLTDKTIFNIIKNNAESQFTLRLWFLYEFLIQKKLQLPDADNKIRYTRLIDDKIQFSTNSPEKSPRHRIINNLPGTLDFCPLIHRTETLSDYLQKDLRNNLKENLAPIHKDLLRRAASFLMIKDSKASFTIEGEPAKNRRTNLWAKAIGEAGKNKLSHKELARLQKMVILNPDKLHMGYREEGGFIGEHDRITASPIPDHISACPKDIPTLMDGLLATYKRLQDDHFDPVLSATMIAFGFVFIHPFSDGNGRIHRYLIHHILSKMEFSEQGIVFPVSAAILQHINDYQLVLESYSHPLLAFIEWEETEKHNVRVTNDTIDFYRYFDATQLAEFLFTQIEETITSIIPEEIKYLQNYDEFTLQVEQWIDLPDLSLLATFLGQNQGKLSQGKREKFFPQLNDDEVGKIEMAWKEVFDS